MFENISALIAMFQHGPAIREALSKLQDEAEVAQYTGDSADGRVRTTVNGRSRVLSVSIDPDLPGSCPTLELERLILESITKANQTAKDDVNRQIDKVMEGINLPTFANLLRGRI